VGGGRGGWMLEGERSGRRRRKRFDAGFELRGGRVGLGE